MYYLVFVFVVFLLLNSNAKLIKKHSRWENFSFIFNFKQLINFCMFSGKLCLSVCWSFCKDEQSYWYYGNRSHRQEGGESRQHTIKKKHKADFCSIQATFPMAFIVWLQSIFNLLDLGSLKATSRAFPYQWGSSAGRKLASHRHCSTAWQPLAEGWGRVVGCHSRARESGEGWFRSRRSAGVVEQTCVAYLTLFEVWKLCIT